MVICNDPVLKFQRIILILFKRITIYNNQTEKNDFDFVVSFKCQVSIDLNYY